MTTTTRRLGDADVFPIGLGAMPLSLEGRPGEDRAIRTILPRLEASSPLRSAALDAGVNLIDSADAYAPDESEVGHKERLIAKALRGPLGGIGRADATHGVSPQRVALAWLLALGPTVIPIPGSSRPETIADSARAVELTLSGDEVRAISEAAGV